MRHQDAAQRADAFTLIELLVTLVIIGVLVGLVLAGVGLSRGEAQAAACLSNQRQLGQGVAGYVAQYRAMPGMSRDVNITPGEQRWGTEPVPGVQVDQWAVYNSERPMPDTGQVETGPVGLGYLYPVIYGRGAFHDGPDGRATDGRVFFCPGMAASFGTTGGTYDGMYEKQWLHNDLTHTGFGEPGRFARGSYVWRGAAYVRNPDLPDSDPGWGDPGQWNRKVLRPDDPRLAGRSMVTCYYPYHEFDGLTITTRLSAAELPHKGKAANLLKTDGSAQRWKLPPGVLPFSTRNDSGVYLAELFYTEPSVIASMPGDDRYVQHCAPWWWIKADRQDEE